MLALVALTLFANECAVLWWSFSQYRFFLHTRLAIQQTSSNTLVIT